MWYEEWRLGMNVVLIISLYFNYFWKYFGKMYVIEIDLLKQWILDIDKLHIFYIVSSAGQALQKYRP